MTKTKKEKILYPEDPYGIFQQMSFPINRKNFEIKVRSSSFFFGKKRPANSAKYSLWLKNEDNFGFDELFEYCKKRYLVKEILVYKYLFYTFVEFSLENLNYLIENKFEILKIYRENND